METNWHGLREKLIAEFPCDPISIHGPAHWKRVEQNALLIAPDSGAIIEIVRLFAIFHDCRREHDGWDDTHGAKGAEYAALLRGTFFDLPDDHFQLLHYACTWHTHEKTSENPTIGTCWDADRLDLGRVGMRPSAEFMSTDKGKALANGTR